jgi:hypothetical protein
MEMNEELELRLCYQFGERPFIACRASVTSLLGVRDNLCQASVTSSTGVHDICVEPP